MAAGAGAAIRARHGPDRGSRPRLSRPPEQRALGGRAGFRIPANGSQTVEYRGAAVGTWLVLELCSTTTPGHDPGAICDVLDATLELRDARPAAPAAGGEVVATAGGLYQFGVPSGFSPASTARQNRLTRDLQVGQATLIRRSWENTIVVVASKIMRATTAHRPTARDSASCLSRSFLSPPTGSSRRPAPSTAAGRSPAPCARAPAGTL